MLMVKMNAVELMKNRAPSVNYWTAALHFNAIVPELSAMKAAIRP